MNLVKMSVVSLALVGILSAEGILDQIEGEKQQQEETQTQKIELQKENSKSGFFLGIEGSVSGISYSGGVDYDFGGRTTLDNSVNKVIFDIGLSFGYQHYFGESENHGIKSSFYVGAGTPYNSKNEKVIDFDNPPSSKGKDEVSLKTQAIPLKTRIELDYLWDFFQKGKHTIGLDAGIGYELGVWFGNGEARRRQIYTNPANANDVAELPITNKKISTNLITHNFYPKIGLHYYYGNHQFNIAYKFGGILSGITGDKKLLIKPNEGIDPFFNLDFKESIQSSPSYFSFGYSYRF